MDYTEQALDGMSQAIAAHEQEIGRALTELEWQSLMHSLAVEATAEVLRLREENAKLLLSLRKLRHEVYALHAFEPEVRDAIGHSNWRCLMDRARESEEPPCQKS